MSVSIYLRSLEIKDAETSYKWRNDPEIWRYTNFTPKTPITFEIERRWMVDVLKRKNEERFAICIADTDEYIGNIQLLDIYNNMAEFHLFIGEKKYWGKGIGYEATRQLLAIAFVKLKLDIVFLNVHPANIIAFRCYERAGFKVVDNVDIKTDEAKMVKMEARTFLS